ncbi:hypothetical protein HOLleu_05296 [Holothuria leucospilota]|uniref:Uncharacterized protein n=1 Tax=Holothuria leucospilota TaxID=206669 RepID=A0A9Q1CKW8_HOLLE|nr:hypothetical protein HOLleu_05296 [Holothuria leucospilota]
MADNKLKLYEDKTETYPDSEIGGFGIKSGSKRKGSPTSSATQKKHRTESPCHTCSTSGGLVHTSTDVTPADNTVQETLRAKLTSVLEDKLTYVCGGGKEKTCTNKDMNISFMEDYFPDAFETPYRWPLRFDFKHSSYSTDDLREPKEGKSGWLPLRRGDEAEHKTFHMLAEMFYQKNIPSFIISGYTWMKMFPKELLRVLKEELPTDKIREGEIDLLIFLPNKGVLALEVKSRVNTEDKRSLKRVIEKGFREQCTKAVKFLVNSSYDLTDGVNYILIKVMSFPNCSRINIGSLICQNCSEHFITQDDLQSTNKLYKWFELLLEKYSTHPSVIQFNSKVYTSIISRLLGPHLRVEIKDVIKETHKQIDQIEGSITSKETKWIQLNRRQVVIASKNPHFLWLTGDPGSGKTILADWKVTNILHKKTGSKHIIYLIAGNRDMLFKEWMNKWFTSKLVGEEKNFELKIEAIEDSFGRSHQYQLGGLLAVVEKLKKKHVDSDLSIIIDEFRILAQNTSEQTMKKFSNLGLKNLWVILNPFSLFPGHSVLLSLGFEIFHLNGVMRMSMTNLNFVNHWLGKSYKIGHSIDGLTPKIYKMECICGDLAVKEVHSCTPLLISKLTEYVSRE